MITPAQQKRIHQKLARQEQIRKEEENQRIRSEEFHRKEQIRQENIKKFANKCFLLEAFQFTDSDILVNGRFSDRGNGFVRISYSCNCVPRVQFSDIQRMASLVGSDKISFYTECNLNDCGDRYEKDYTLNVEIQIGDQET